MTHARRQIREAVATALTGLAATGTRVFQSRMRPATVLPCLLIQLGPERVEQGTQALQARELTVIVRGMAKAAADIDDALDAIAEQVETAAQAAGTFGSKMPGGLVLTSIDTEFDDALEQPVGVVVMEYRAGYFTTAGAPGTFV